MIPIIMFQARYFHEEDNWGLPMKMRKIAKLPEALYPSTWKKCQIDRLSERVLLRNMMSQTMRVLILFVEISRLKHNNWDHIQF